MSEYNGWTNYETWLVALYMDNDQGTYEYYRELATGLKDSKSDLANVIKDEHETMVYLATENYNNTFISDLLNAAMSEVNWYEIAENLLNGLEE